MLKSDEKYKKIDDLSTDLQENVEEIDDRVTQEETPDPIIASSASYASSNNNQEYPPDCYYCKEVFDGIAKQRYQKHVTQKHPGKSCYPGKADIKLYSLTPKGMPWEI